MQVKLFEYFINENKQVGILYHYTGISRLQDILEDFKLNI